jgi:polysaccharide biosynthesis protein VpsQ
LRRWLFTGAWLLFVAMIIYFADRHLARSFFSFVQQLPGADKAGHFVLIGGVAFFLNTSLGAREISAFGRKFLLGSMIVAAVFTLEEITQMRIPWRTFDYGDLAADYAGIIFFGWLARRAIADTVPSVR